jgi:hypothetical protein
MKALLLVAAALFTSCVTYTPPERFMKTAESGSQLKAVTPEESKLWIRDFDDDDQGGLAFWHDALVKDLKDNRGYVVIADVDTKDGSGNAGKELVLESTVNGRPVRELLALFVYGGWLSDRIRVVEYVAEKPQFDKEVDGVRKSFATLKP